MSEFVWAPTPELIAQSTLTAFLRHTSCADYDALVRRADAEPAWFWAEVIRFVEAAGGTMSDIVKVLIFVSDIKQRHEVWRARREFYTGDFPASTMVEVRSLASPELLIAAEAIAVLGAGKS